MATVQCLEQSLK
uniref:Uncharacterized protein n=1 Tax=Anguilla anguilla TaxID=7936 RepID=A0A0E9S2M9_ANGAN